MLDVRGLVSFADFFLLMSGGSTRQLNAIQEEVSGKLKKEDKVTPLRREGSTDSGWLLLDYGDVVVHIFAPEQRQYYQLDELWGGAETVLRIQ